MGWARKQRKSWRAEWRRPDRTDDGLSGFSTKKAAERYANEVERKLAAGIEFDPKAGGITFREVAEIWLESRKADTRNNAANHRYALAPAATRRGDGKTLGIDAVFGGYPLNKITRDYIQQWVNKLVEAGKKPSTVRHAFWTVRMVLEQAVEDGRIAKSPAAYVKLPKESGANGGEVGVVDRAQFLTSEQVAALIDATPWPYNVLVDLAVWSGLRAAELGGLQIKDIDLPDKGHATVNVERTARFSPNTEEDEDFERYGPTKTKGSVREVPLRPQTTELLRDYLDAHPRREESEAPLFPSFTLKTQKPTGVKAVDTGQTAADRQATALAALSVNDAEKRLEIDWYKPLRHQTFYKGIYRPAVLRANRLAGATVLPPALRFHSLRHTYASLCAKVGTISIRQVAEWMGHANATTTEHVYTHLYKKHDYNDEMAALGGLATGKRARRAANGGLRIVK